MTYTVNEIPTDYGRTRGSADNGSSGAGRAFFAEAYDRTNRTVQALGREAGVVAGGAVLGAMDECRKDPVGTAVRAGTNVIVGAGLGTLAVAECPLIAGGAVIAGVAFTGVWAAKTLNPAEEANKARFAKIGLALNDTWWNADDVTFRRSMENMREGAGPIALDVGLMALGGSSARLAGGYGSSALKSLSVQEAALAPAVVPNYYKSGLSGLGKLGQFIDDFAAFKARHGKLTTNSGAPETIEARLELMDRAKGLPYHGEKKHLRIERSLERDWSHELLVPATHKQGVRSRTFYFHRDQR